ncbi:hypothetical protein BV22DRAFT_265940 [Leucogyrophana mollusca]|uniref:Uncharacterized protein n=1 Tax=Leucogyrophana mollusca TaxID=85980 RepID=A0ACB8BQR2_9AGAM|nr:hypothetical protein BV22DRAFT_265940 [Leucogyrophana mollusca]
MPVWDRELSPTQIRRQAVLLPERVYVTWERTRTLYLGAMRLKCISYFEVSNLILAERSCRGCRPAAVIFVGAIQPSRPVRRLFGPIFNAKWYISSDLWMSLEASIVWQRYLSSISPPMSFPLLVIVTGSASRCHFQLISVIFSGISYHIAVFVATDITTTI